MNKFIKLTGIDFVEPSLIIRKEQIQHVMDRSEYREVIVLVDKDSHRTYKVKESIDDIHPMLWA